MVSGGGVGGVVAVSGEGEGAVDDVVDVRRTLWRRLCAEVVGVVFCLFVDRLKVVFELVTLRVDTLDLAVPYPGRCENTGERGRV